jgi:site-specific DNA-methyltransferase (cytosine-N4-specific)
MTYALKWPESLSPLDFRLAGLKAIDWNFAGRGKGHGIEGIHPYPAKFIADIPRTFLASLPVPENTAVFDPFCGSGTTLSESQRFGMASFGIDLNPIACLISRVKTAPIPDQFERMAVTAMDGAKTLRDPMRREIPNIDHWFNPEIQEAIAALIHSIEANTPAACHDALKLALSSILVRVSNQESDTRYAAVEKNIAKADVFTEFLGACGKLAKALLARNWSLSPVEVIEGDTLTVRPERIGLPVGLVVTSPPYPNAYEYWLYHKYRMWWLGFDPLAVKSKEIGARAHFFKRNHHTEQDFWEQMRATFRLIDGVLVRSGFACVVVGRSRIHGRTIDNAGIVQAVAFEFGMEPLARFERVISPHRKSFNLAHANIKTETVLVLRKD